MDIPNAIMGIMKRIYDRAPVNTGPTIAYAFVVMMVFLSIFGTNRSITNTQIGALVTLGICYLFLGIYGFHICLRSDDKNIYYLYFGAQIVIGGSLIFLSEGQGLSPLLLMPLVGQSVVLLQPRPMIITNGLIVVIYFIALRYYTTGWIPFWNSIPFYLAGQIVLIFFLQLAGDEDRTHDENRRLIRELGEANASLREYTGKVEELTITRERNRMAREIHDGVGHYLTVINMQIQAALAIMQKDPAKARDTLARAMNQTQGALNDIRKSVSILRESTEDQIDLLESLENLRTILLDSRISPNIEIIGNERKLPEQVNQTILRILQEGIQNCIKHAQADQIEIMLDYSFPDKIRLRICDNGHGAENQGSGFGLISLQERVRILNGEFSFGNSSTGGFFIDVEVPV